MNLHFEELTGTDGARIGIASLDAQASTSDPAATEEVIAT